ncbi:hypothetical protein [Bradyrhizobium zhanjiangense]|uniref:Uncharacterized protein n=1 Tax=Bradyrhizobium zhanjiangense TaxID=1325107 RepID=A0A4Q0SS21_9BRAD|nr:hypothetical protein [Bradyrhizobium zhanjiangense]RXH40941.1 hypothetical protein XH94_10835 [Bradyrhizobium zhanjiangense]
MPAEPKIKDWLGYIRPHIANYEALGRGGRRDYIAKLSEETDLSDNSLRRMIFAAQFLEGEGVTELPPGGKLAVGAVERVARIAAREPDKRRQLLADVMAGKLTIFQLRKMLEKSEKAAKRARKQAPEISVVARAKAELMSRNIATLTDMVDVDILSMPDARWFLSQARPARAIILPLGKKAGERRIQKIVVFDETVVGGTEASFIRLRKEFIQNILIAPIFYDLVLVWAPSLRTDVNLLINSMRDEVQSQIVLMEQQANIEKASSLSPILAKTRRAAS